MTATHCFVTPLKRVANAAVAMLAMATCAARGHQLPISSLTIVADEAYVHVEIVINAEELVHFAALDDDGDQRLSADELAEHGGTAASAVFDKLILQAGERQLVAESVGYVPGGDGHHLAFRAHYLLPAQRGPTALTVESRLGEIVTGAHATQVTYQAAGSRETAVLDSRTPRASFGRNELAESAPQPEKPLASLSGTSTARRKSWRKVGVVGLAAVALCALFFLGGRHPARASR